jgi:transposase InsO family protein
MKRLGIEGVRRGAKCWTTIRDNVLAETINGLYKTEVIRHRGPWKNIDEVEYATLDWVDWFNNRRILEPIGNIPPAEYELMYYQHIEESSEAA